MNFREEDEQLLKVTFEQRKHDGVDWKNIWGKNPIDINMGKALKWEYINILIRVHEICDTHLRCHTSLQNHLPSWPQAALKFDKSTESNFEFENFVWPTMCVVNIQMILGKIKVPYH